MKWLGHTTPELNTLLLLLHLLWLLLALSHLPGEGVLSLSLDMSAILEIRLRWHELHPIKIDGVLHLLLLGPVQGCCLAVD